MLDACVPASLEDRQEAHEIRLGIVMGSREGMPHPHFGGEVDHALRLMFCEQAVQRRLVRDVAPNEGERVLLLKLGQPRLLEADVIVVIEVVEPDHFIAAVEQCRRRMESDETGGASD